MKRWILNVLIVIFALIFLVSGYFLVDYFLEANKQQGAFDSLAQIMEQSAKDNQSNHGVRPGTTASDDPAVSDDSPLVEVTDPETGEAVYVLPEFVELYKMNNDIVGWISIDDTRIDYPVMQNSDYTDYYLYRNFNEEYSKHGCIYVREVCDVFTPSDNLTIYGHRMGDGTMFNALHDYADQDFYEEHRYITFNTLTEYHTYEIMAIFRIASTVGNPFQYHLFVDAADEAHFDEYVQNCLSRSLYDTGVTASYGDKLITLSTCEYTQTNGRLVVVAKRIS